MPPEHFVLLVSWGVFTSRTIPIKKDGNAFQLIDRSDIRSKAKKKLVWRHSELTQDGII